ncbi:hypothetical protein ATCC90586_004362 [Pythium insidiosum]|nr:hypothetical protein ATCC90586_004362 [Pythium insidiosum]
MNGKMVSKTSPAFVHRLDLTGGCTGRSDRMGHTPVDLSRVMADADSLQALVSDLTRPFESEGVDMVIAVHIAENAGDCMVSTGSKHRFTSVISGAIASSLRVGVHVFAVFDGHGGSVAVE